MVYRLAIAGLYLLTTALCWLLGGWYGYYLLEEESLKESFRYQQLVGNELNRYRPIPELAAQHPAMRAVLEHPEDVGLVLQSNIQMARMADIVGASDVYLLDMSGLTIAHNNYNQADSFIGRRFDYRPYFQDAVSGRDTALYFALGITSGQRGLYFSHPVWSARGDMLGVLAVKMLVTELESQWQRPASFSDAEMVVLDGDGVSFLTSRPEWLYRSFGQQIDGSQIPRDLQERYPGMALQSVPRIDLGRPFGVSEQSTLVRFPEDKGELAYLVVATPLPQLDWSLRVIMGTQPVLVSRIQFVLVGSVLFFGGFLSWLYLRERSRREAELAERGVQLEQRVAERTADLESSNRRLQDEVRQRERAQNELRETQQELIQAAKLAVLGQMSAGLNHEMNQPLTAIQSYAGNSRRFLERGELAAVDENLAEIGGLCRKMAELIRQFKVFARKSEGPPSVVDLRLPIDAAMKIIATQDACAGIRFGWRRPVYPVMCHGDLIRLEQVMVNLMANAAQAVASVSAPAVEIDIVDGGDNWLCIVRDNGPGLPSDSEQMFEPFFTTKSLHQGLGLGLSISRQIVEALGGKLTGRNRSVGFGAEFIIELTKRETKE
ncbi:sensor histidine kinase [Marinobacter zhejiangensis]|uniref:C4-dicarboxylate transport sensor protein DctB n=1 Tax=Marinobacter zhejiangensis TaxID=488535 RepID=A0A1I4MA33_9GAMM|nr:ATP-binding protein [Marinobacter zhejiangensis]SFM00020.1 two-component system, NtrC family, C4-dicarboxylate transport sensor histidine kinase DctB [Marinobacter zhejiangensis]